MLELKNIKKDYRMGDMTVHALKGISISFRESEFVSVLGPSGCGKTTLLNLIGGLDSYTSGDLVINGRSTKSFRDRDWDVYRNHRIGFIFQTYNLIPHQTVLSNVELALTIAGLPKAERVAKAKAALDKVGLSDQYYKRPNQLSGGQSQRVAIARALVNDPEILLADEPTGALDTTTSVQIMDLIQEISRDRLVIMVTHNPELAEKYSTRIIRLLDGELTDDTNPFDGSEELGVRSGERGMGKESGEKTDVPHSPLLIPHSKAKRNKGKEKAKMSFWTAFKLSLHNLLTKKRRTFMTSFAGSIGIIGVSLVLSVSYGVQSYIDNMQNDMLSGNPITVSETALNISAMMQQGGDGIDRVKWENGKVNVSSTMASLVKRSENMSNLMQSNEITQDYIDYVLSMPKEDCAAVFLDYGLNLSNNIYTDFTPAVHKPSINGEVLDRGDADEPSNMSLAAIKETYASVLASSDYSDYAPYIGTLDDVFRQISANDDYILKQYDLLPGGKYATEPGDIMLVVQKNRTGMLGLSDLLLAQLGYFTQNEFMNMVFKATVDMPNGAKDLYVPQMDKFQFEFDEFTGVLGKTFTYYPNTAAFEPSKHMLEIPGVGAGTMIDADTIDISSFRHVAFSKYIPEAKKALGIPLRIVGILEPNDDFQYGSLETGFFYTEALRDEIFKLEKAHPSAIVEELTKSGSISSNIGKFSAASSTTIMTGVVFDYDFVYPYVDGEPKPAKAYATVGSGNALAGIAGLFGGMVSNMGGGSGSEMLEGIIAALSAKTLSLRDLTGRRVVWEDDQLVFNETIANYIEIYPVDFKTKERVLEHLKAWNNKDEAVEFTRPDGTPVKLEAGTRAEVTYQDFLSLIIAMIKTFIDIITTALVCFTSLALVVSTVMIAIITYVSVVERIKEIGVIRSLGGRKRDVSYLFNAETFMIGLVSGVLGIAVTYLGSFIINLFVHAFNASIGAIAVFPIWMAAIMVGVSVGLSLFSGFFPSRSAAKKDPVVALRTE